jgi:hypothetical protein
LGSGCLFFIIGYIHEKAGIVAFFRSSVRAILMADLVISILVGIVCIVLKLYTFEAYGTLLVWAGMAVLFLTCIMGIGGFASRTQDMAAFSVTKAGDPFENLLRVSEARQSSFGCFLQLIGIAAGLIGFGYLIQNITNFF